MNCAVTGAFSYTGKYIAGRLLEAGHTVRTLSRRKKPDDPHLQPVLPFPFDFEN